MMDACRSVLVMPCRNLSAEGDIAHYAAAGTNPVYCT